MKQLAIFAETERGKRIKNLIIGLGASVVLIGALFKLQHYPGASTFLIIGMTTEAFIFALLGVLPPHKDYYWEKIYPELNIAPTEEELERSSIIGKTSVTEQLDTMLVENNVEPAMIKRLGESLKQLGENINKLSDASVASIATEDYSQKTREATAALADMKVAYASATEAANSLASSSTDTKKYHEQVQQVTQNLAQLNAIYELELQDTNNHLKTMNKFYGNLSQAMDNLTDSITDTNSYKSEISKLSKNLSSLNNVYGNMLSAMTLGGNKQ